MQDTAIKIETRIVGRRTPLRAPWHMVLSASLLQDSMHADYTFRLRDLIEQVVREGVHAFQIRQEERCLLHVLGPREIATAASSSKITLGEVQEGWAKLRDTVNEDTAVETALQAFADGLYLVLLDGQQQRDLNALVYLCPESTLTFLRLIALAGG